MKKKISPVRITPNVYYLAKFLQKKYKQAGKHKSIGEVLEEIIDNSNWRK